MASRRCLRSVYDGSSSARVLGVQFAMFVSQRR